MRLLQSINVKECRDIDTGGIKMNRRMEKRKEE